jgi:hypothetical protein
MPHDPTAGERELELALVLFADTGELREVTHACRRCYRTGANLRELELEIVSPVGTAHRAGDDTATACGIDAEDTRYWWAE